MNFFIYTNEKVSSILNEFVLSYHLESFITFFADFPIFFIPVFLLFMWFYWTFKQNIEKKRELLFIFFSSLLAVVVNIIIQYFIHIQRPETYIKPILSHIPDASFPSDHAAVSFAFLFSLYLFGYKKVFWIFLPFVLVMDLSRIAWWVHWFWDILAGIFVWFLSAILIWKFRNTKFLSTITSLILKLANVFKL